MPAGSDKLIFTPWLIGERTPVEDHTIRGGFFNMSLSTTRAHMVRSVFEGVAYNSRWLLEAVEDFIGKKIPRINMIGGGARSDLWCQIHADVLNREILQVEDAIQANVRGVGVCSRGCLWAGSSSKIFPVASRFKKPTTRTRRTGGYMTNCMQFKNVYAAHKKIHERLNKDHI